MGSNIQVADTWASRLRGYVGRPAPAEGEGLLLSPCTGIHTLGMGFSIDVLFLDDEGKVLDLIPALRPWRRSRRVSDARYVLELPTGTIKATGTDVGDVLSWQLPRKVPDLNKPALKKRRADRPRGEERKSA